MIDDDSFSKAEARFDEVWNEAVIQEIRKNPGKFGPKLSDQEIRARALECAVRWLSSRTDALEAVGITDDEIKTLFWGFAQDFEAYIRDGVT